MRERQKVRGTEQGTKRPGTVAFWLAGSAAFSREERRSHTDERAFFGEISAGASNASMPHRHRHAEDTP